MPLLMCPNCQAEMKEINRQNVQIDVCVKCNGVWLDRGELNKLLEINKQDLDEAYSGYTQQQSSPQQQTQHYNQGYQQHDKHKHKKKSKFESIFELFE